MLNTIDLREISFNPIELTRALPRAQIDIDIALESVRPIIAQVRQSGAEALRDLSERFDGVRPDNLRVDQSQIDQALQELDPQIRQALEICIDHNRQGHQAQMPTSRTSQIVPGGMIEQRWIPVRRVGLYVPGGLAVYPSSVVMNAITAQVAGVEQIALASPPQKEFGGQVHPTILAACALLNISEVYAVGGAQAVAMFAYGAVGSEPQDGSVLCEAVDVVTGPGNIYVAAAKRAVAGICGIDAEAGTTEIAIIADESANARYIAADLISQAEHDPAAASILITDSVVLADKVCAEISEQAQATKHTKRICTALSGPQSGIVLVKDRASAIEVANAYGAEHLEIHTRTAQADSQQIRNAGAIFIGDFTPVPLGDYLAGSNHVLPTGGTSRFQSGLSVMAFLKPMQVVEYQQSALKKLSSPLTALALSEDLPAHARAVNIRQEQS